MGQGGGAQFIQIFPDDAAPSGIVVVTIFEPLLVAFGEGRPFVVLRFTGQGLQHEARIDSFPSSRKVRLRDPGTTGRVQSRARCADSQGAPTLEVQVVLARSCNDFHAGHWDEFATVPVPLGAFVRNKGRASGRQSSSVAQCAMLGFQEPPGRVSEDEASQRRLPAADGSVEERFAQSLELGRRLETPKVFLSICDEKFALPAAASEPKMRLEVCTMKSKGGAYDRNWRASDPIAAILSQVDTVVRRLHRSLEEDGEAALGDETSEAWSVIEASRSSLAEAGAASNSSVDVCLSALMQRDCEAFGRENALLRVRLDQDQQRYELEVSQLRIGYRKAQREREKLFKASSGIDEGTEDSDGDHRAEGVPAESASGCSTPGRVLTPCVMTPVRPSRRLTLEERRHALLKQREETERQVHNLSYELHQQKMKNAGAEHRAFQAIQEKEKCLRLFAACHEELSQMQEHLKQTASRRQALETEVEELKHLDEAQ